MKKAIIYLLLSSLLLMSSLCSNPNKFEEQNTLIFSTSLSLQFQDTLFNEHENIWLTFNVLNSDSRCPVDVECFWEGNAKLGFSFMKDNNKKDFFLNTHIDFSNDTTLYDYNISLIDVLPEPHTDSLFAENDYTAIIKITN